MSAARRLAGSHALAGAGFSILDFRLLPLFPGTCSRRSCLLTSDSCSSPPATYDKPPTVYKLSPVFSITFPLSTRNYLYFLQHSRFVAPLGKPVLCFHRHSGIVRSLFELTGASPFPLRVTHCRRPGYGPRVPPSLTPLRCSRRSAVARSKKATHNPRFTMN